MKNGPTRRPFSLRRTQTFPTCGNHIPFGGGCFLLNRWNNTFSRMDTVKLTTAPTAANTQVWRISPELTFTRTLSNVPPAVPALVPPPLNRLAIFSVRFSTIFYGRLANCGQNSPAYGEIATQGNYSGR